MAAQGVVAAEAGRQRDPSPARSPSPAPRPGRWGGNCPPPPAARVSDPRRLALAVLYVGRNFQFRVSDIEEAVLGVKTGPKASAAAAFSQRQRK